ncbi:MAG: hypothetical protein JSS27_04620 [Planctomycetes bacterium]|nr:hypothetical protein [Planctomycetota bacterium]
MDRGAQRTLAVALMWAGLAIGVAKADEAAADTPEQVEKLINQLDADTFAAREEATAALIALGDEAAAAVAKELESPRSAEVRRRGTTIAKAIRLNRMARDAVRLDELLALVRGAGQRDLDQEALEGRLNRLAVVLSEATGNKELKLPVHFNAVAEQAVDLQRGQVKQALVMADSVALSVVEDSIILADYAAEVSIAKRSIIIARYAVQVNNAENCVIISGRNLHVSMDKGSAVISGRDCQVNVSDRSILAGEKVDSHNPKSVIFVNGKPDKLRTNIKPADACQAVTTPGLVIRPAKDANPLAEKIVVTYSMGSANSRGTNFVLFTRVGHQREYVARVGQDLRSPDGSEIPGLSGWTLRYCSSQMAVFSNGKEESALEVTRR